MREVTVTIRVPELNLRAHAQRLRAPERLVLWGGRPGRDRQFGSQGDLVRASRERVHAKYRAILRVSGMNAAMAEFQRTMTELVHAHSKAMAGTAQRLRDAGLLASPPARDPRLEDLIRRARQRRRYVP